MITVVPEPSTWLLFITGSAAFLVRRKYRRKTALA
ncbi:MAG: PEP-CTERM sorting domain-containing protein [Kiritimatiellia bacterium]